MRTWDRINDAMIARKVTPAELSRLTGITPGNISGWKSMKYEPSADALVKISKALDVPLGDLYGAEKRAVEANDHHYILSNDEHTLIKGLRSIDEYTRSIVIRMASAALATPVKEESTPVSASIFSPLKDENVSHEQEQGYKRVEGKAAAGSPINAVPDLETRVSVPAKYLSENYFIVQAQGDSMIDANIDDGDYCVFQKDAYFDEGSIMLAQVDSTADEPDVAIKRVFRHKGHIELRSENPKYEPMVYPVKNVHLMGVLVDVMTPDSD